MEFRRKFWCSVMGQDRLEPLIAQITEESMAVLVKGNYCDMGLWSAQAASNYLRLNSGGSNSSLNQSATSKQFPEVPCTARCSFINSTGRCHGDSWHSRNRHAFVSVSVGNEENRFQTLTIAEGAFMTSIYAK